MQQQEPETKNLFLAMALCLVILLGWEYLGPKPKVVPPTPTAAEQSQIPGAGPGVAPVEEPKLTRTDALAASKRLIIDTPSVEGSINLKGARFDDLTLKRYHQELAPNSPAIVLLSPSGSADAYFAEQGWSGKSVKVPDDDTLWTASSDKLTPQAPVTLSWDNGDGLKFTRIISVDDKYAFTVKQAVTNSGSAPVSLTPYALVSRSSIPVDASTSSWSYSFQGAIGNFDGVEKDVLYKSIGESGTDAQSAATKGGWFGFNDKYWLTSVAPADQDEAVQASFKKHGSNTPIYQADFAGPEQSVAPGATIENSVLVFAGPKEVNLLADYRESLHLKRFDYAVDWGWFWFFTRPIFYVLDIFYHLTGNFGIAILLLTLLMRGAFFPLQTRAVKNMNKMKVLQPEVKKLQEKFADDKVRLQQETMALYKRVGANPVAGCLPIAVQIPVFFSLYKVLNISLEMRHAPFFGWIHDLSAPDPTSLFNLFGAIPFTPPAFLPLIGIWPCLYCVTMVLQQRMQPMQVDPVQARMFQFMPFLFTFMMANAKVPVGLMIYWSWSNLLTIGQQWLITKRTKAAVPAAAE